MQGKLRIKYVIFFAHLQHCNEVDFQNPSKIRGSLFQRIHDIFLFKHIGLGRQLYIFTAKGQFKLGYRPHMTESSCEDRLKSVETEKILTTSK